MAWSAYFNHVFLGFQKTYLEICETYPRIGEIFQKNPKLIEDENAMLPLYYLWSGGILTLDEKNEQVAEKVCEILSAGVKDSTVLAATVGILHCMKDYDRLGVKSHYQIFLNMQDPQLLKFFIHMIVTLDECDVLNEQEFDHIFHLLSTQLKPLLLFQQLIHHNDVDVLPISDRKAFWHTIFRLVEHDIRLFYQFVNLISYLDDYNGLTSVRFKEYMDALRLSLPDEDVPVNAIVEFVNGLRLKITTLQYLEIDSDVRNHLVLNLKFIHLLCSMGIPIDDLVPRIAAQSAEERQQFFKAVNSHAVVMLECLLRTGLVDSDIAISICTSKALAALETTYKEMLFQNVADEDKFFEKIAGCLKQSAEFEREEKLQAFADSLKNFSWLGLAKPVQEYMHSHRAKVLMVCKTGVSIEEFAKISFFHQKILENMNIDSKGLLRAIADKVPERWYYFILMNAMPVIKDIADVFVQLNVALHHEAYLIQDMLLKLSGFMKDKTEKPAVFVEFFKGYYQDLKQFKVADLNHQVASLLQMNSGLIHDLCDTDSFSFTHFLTFDEQTQRRLLNLPANVAKLVVYLSGCYAKEVDDEIHIDYTSLPLFIGNDVVHHLHALIAAMRDDDISDISENIFRRIASSFAEFMMKKNADRDGLIEGLAHCLSVLQDEQQNDVSSNAAVSVGLFRQASNDSGCLSDDEYLSTDSLASLEFD